MKKKISYTYPVILILSFVISLAGCSKNDGGTPEPPPAPVVQAPVAKVPVLATSDVTFTPMSPAGKITGYSGVQSTYDIKGTVYVRAVRAF